MPKLQNVGGNRELPKVPENSNMRSTNLKLDPIETGNFVNPNGPTGIMTSQNVNQSAQFQKGMLTPIDSVKIHGNAGGANSPSMKKNVNNKMNMSMYAHRNQDISASQNQAPRRMADQLSPLAAFEIERE